LLRSTQESGLSDKKKRDAKSKSEVRKTNIESDRKTVKGATNRIKCYLEYCLKNTISHVSFKSVILSFFDGPPDKLAEAFIFTCELKIGYQG